MSQIALVGCAHIHTPSFVKRLGQRPETVVRYVWDHDGARAERYARELGVETTSNPARVWDDPAVEAVVICSETNMHEELVLAAVAARKHLFVEKPLGMGAADAYSMAAAIEQAGLLFQTGYFMRGDPINQFLRAQIRAGSFGTLTRIRHSNCHVGSLSGWFDTEWLWMTDPRIAGVGAFGDLGTHSLDLLLWLLGDAASVTASIGVATGRYGDCDEFGEGLLRFESGAVGTLAAGWVDIANPVTHVISGTEGHAYVAGDALYFKSNRVEGADGERPWTELPVRWPHAFELFLDAIGGQEDAPLVSAREAAVRSAVMEAMYEGARSGRWVVPRGGN